MAEIVDVTILGGGPVGLFASFYAGIRHMSVRIIDSLPELGGQLMALYPEKFIYDMPGFPKILAKDLALQLAEQGTQFNPEVVLGHAANHLVNKGDYYEITLTDGTVWPTRTIIIAAGAGAFSPTKLGVENEDNWIGKGLSYGVKSKADFADKHILVVGGGDSAFDWALNLHGIAKSIKILHRRDQFKAHEQTISQVQALEIPIVTWRSISQINGEIELSKVVVQHTQTKEFEEICCDAVIVNIGFKSSLGPISTWGLNVVKNQILVDHLYQTNLERVFAVGDVATFEGKIKLIATGVGEAATAVCIAKTLLDPTAKLFPGHSSDLDLSAALNL